MLPGGKLYVPAPSKLLPNMRQDDPSCSRCRVFLVSHGCFHPADDPEFGRFPPIARKEPEGAEYVPEALADKVYRVPNEPSASVPPEPLQYQQIFREAALHLLKS